MTGAKLTSCDQIPIERQKDLCLMDYLEIIRPFVNDDLIKGASLFFIAIKYGIQKHQARSIAIQLGISKPR
jgi:hypothetical protein